MYHKIHLLFFLFLLVAFQTFAKNPIKFGKVSIDDFNQKVYPIDTSAAAVVLCQYGLFDSKQFRFIVTRRVKILKKEGVDFATYIFKGGNDVIVKGITYNLENGEIVEEKLKKESIFNERLIDRFYLVRVAMPNVKVGSIIDIETSDLGLPSEFRFQEKMPVLHAEIELEPNSNIQFNKRQVGYIKIYNNGYYNYFADNVPAFKPEKYMNSEENYITKFEFDLLQISYPGYFKSFTTSWNAVYDYLYDNNSFGVVLRSSTGYLSELEAEIRAKFSNPLEMTKAAYNAIKVVSWNKNESLYSSTSSLSFAFKKKIGNSADINMMLIQLLKKLDIEAFPVILSTRSNGILNPFIPSIEKLNYMLVCAKIDGKEYLMDATEKHLPFGSLPERCLNGEGRTYEKNENAHWVKLSTTNKDKTIVTYDLKIEDDYSLSGSIKKFKLQNAAYDFRCNFAEYAGEQEFINKIEDTNPGLIIKELKILNLDSLETNIDETYTIQIKNKVETVNDLIMINPYLFDQLIENPFKLEERKYPVDYPFLIDQTLITKISFPSNLTIAEMPKPFKVVLPDNSATAAIYTTKSDGSFQVRYQLQINKNTFQTDEYVLLKELYNQIIKKQSEPIILKPVANAK